MPTVTAEALKAELQAKIAKTPARVDKVFREEVAVKAVRPGVIEVTVSTPSIDRDRERILPSSFKNAKGKLFPFVSQHNYDDSLKRQIGHLTITKITPEAVVAEIEYLVGRGNDEADWAHILARESVAAFSVGFIPNAFQDADLSDERVLRDIVAGKVPLRTYTDNELLETSQVIIGSNRDAILNSVGKGFTKEQADKAINLLDLFEQKAPEIPTGPPAPTPPHPAPKPNPTPPPAPPKPTVRYVRVSDVVEGVTEMKSPTERMILAPELIEAGWVLAEDGKSAMLFTKATAETIAEFKRGNPDDVLTVTTPKTARTVEAPTLSAEITDDVLKAFEEQVPEQRVDPASVTSVVKTLRVYPFADIGHDEMAVLDAEGKEVWRGTPTEMVEALTTVHRTVDVTWNFDPAPFDALVEKITAHLDSVLKAGKEDLAEMVSKLPTIPPDVATQTQLAALAKSVGTAIHDNARAIAEAEVKKALSDPTVFRLNK